MRQLTKENVIITLFISIHREIGKYILTVTFWRALSTPLILWPHNIESYVVPTLLRCSCFRRFRKFGSHSARPQNLTIHFYQGRNVQNIWLRSTRHCKRCEWLAAYLYKKIQNVVVLWKVLSVSCFVWEQCVHKRSFGIAFDYPRRSILRTKKSHINL